MARIQPESSKPHANTGAKLMITRLGRLSPLPCLEAQRSSSAFPVGSLSIVLEIYRANNQEETVFPAELRLISFPFVVESTETNLGTDHHAGSSSWQSQAIKGIPNLDVPAQGKMSTAGVRVRGTNEHMAHASATDSATSAPNSSPN